MPHCDDEAYYYIDALVCAKLTWYDTTLEALDRHNGKRLTYNSMDWVTHHHSSRTRNVTYPGWPAGALLRYHWKQLIADLCLLEKRYLTKDRPLMLVQNDTEDTFLQQTLSRLKIPYLVAQDDIGCPAFPSLFQLAHWVHIFPLYTWPMQWKPVFGYMDEENNKTTNSFLETQSSLMDM